MAAGVHVAQHHRRGGHHQRLLLIALRQGALNPPNTVLPRGLPRGSDKSRLWRAVPNGGHASRGLYEGLPAARREDGAHATHYQLACPGLPFSGRCVLAGCAAVGAGPRAECGRLGCRHQGPLGCSAEGNGEGCQGWRVERCQHAVEGRRRRWRRRRGGEHAAQPRAQMKDTFINNFAPCPAAIVSTCPD